MSNSNFYIFHFCFSNQNAKVIIFLFKIQTKKFFLNFETYYAPKAEVLKLINMKSEFIICLSSN